MSLDELRSSKEFSLWCLAIWWEENTVSFITEECLKLMFTTQPTARCPVSTTKFFKEDYTLTCLSSCLDVTVANVLESLMSRRLTCQAFKGPLACVIRRRIDAASMKLPRQVQTPTTRSFKKDIRPGGSFAQRCLEDSASRSCQKDIGVKGRELLIEWVEMQVAPRFIGDDLTGYPPGPYTALTFINPPPTGSRLLSATA